MFLHENAFESIICEMAAILSRENDLSYALEIPLTKACDGSATCSYLINFLPILKASYRKYMICPCIEMACNSN